MAAGAELGTREDDVGRQGARMGRWGRVFIRRDDAGATEEGARGEPNGHQQCRRMQHAACNMRSCQRWLHVINLTITVCSVRFRIISQFRRDAGHSQGGSCSSKQKHSMRSAPVPVARGAAMSRAVRYWLLTEPLSPT